MSAIGQLADFADPQFVRQLRPALGQLHGDCFASRQLDAVRGELGGRPILFGKLVVGQNRNPFPEHLLKEVRTVAFPVKHDGEPVRAWIFREPLLLLQSLRYVSFQPRNHILLERGNQSGVHFLVHVHLNVAKTPNLRMHADQAALLYKISKPSRNRRSSFLTVSLAPNVRVSRPLGWVSRPALWISRWRRVASSTNLQRGARFTLVPRSAGMVAICNSRFRL